MHQALAMTRRMGAGLALATLGTISLAAGAALAMPARQETAGDLVRVQVLVNGTSAPLYTRWGTWDRSYFQAFRGMNYSLLVTNQTGERVGVLIAVDGLNVVNGERTGLTNHEAMYVLDPYESATINGWRTSLDDVRRFVFVDEDRSYASRTGQANGDMGWIRVLSFREQRPIAWRWERPLLRNDESQGRRQEEAPQAQSRDGAPSPPPAAGGASEYRGEAKAQAKSMLAPEAAAPGTGWGDRRYDPVQRTEFAAATSPTDRIVLRYEYESGLRALGIFPRSPRAWERDRGELGFAQPPRW
jgi:hypothetical protein